MVLAEKIKALRLSKRYTQEELASLTKVSAQTERRWERGERQPKAEDLRVLADALGTTVGYLTGEMDNPAPAGAAPLVDASSATVNAPIAVGRDNVTATTVPQTVTIDLPDIMKFVLQLKKDGDAGKMKDAIDLLEAAISVLKRAVQDRGVMTA